MTNTTSDIGKPARRSQRARSSAARNALINATLACVNDVGLAKTSISEICQRAGLSRGALLHHFPHKNELLVASYVEWIGTRIGMLERRIAAGASVRDEVTAWRAQMRETFPTSLEFYWALQNDADLRERFNTALLSHPIGDDKSGHPVDTCIDESPKPSLTRYVIVCFIRGLCLQEFFVRNPSIPDQAFEHFIEILSTYIERSLSA
ncbi:TetR/AcrR family transcriptional regulator [Burkholderia sp. Ac-20353]|uniref:TetR/AcrR family transcriptional regulator n=1 Tax=Burkholderia sp. Ac-20353 TaxID=2703894 RepID=UPI00197BD100|nr:TetR/AcrR family transcriptional regulator [Burkholderia sp. Ac-20353]MBN3788862.1 TetR/AcrR family transcriptional regulator [Burkholderia sp. Ac-20353]